MNSLAPGVRRVLSTDLRSLALMRIAAGLIVMFDVLFRLRDFQFFYTLDGAFPPIAAVRHSFTGRYGFSLFLISDALWWSALLFGLALLGGFALMIGWRCRFVCPALWVIYVSFFNRVPVAVNAGDRLLIVILFLGMFLPWDRVWAYREKSRRPGFRQGFRIFHVAGALLFLQLLLMYETSVYWKWTPVWVEEGTALHWALRNDAYALPYFQDFLLQRPSLCRWLTHSALAVEALGPVLMLVDRFHLRTLGIGALIGFHLGTLAIFNLGFFPLVCVVGLLGWLPTSFWEGAKARESRILHWRMSAGAALLLLLGAALVGGVLFTGLSKDLRLPVALSKATTFVAFYQKWSLFAPQPSRVNSWLVAVAHYRDGSKRDLLEMSSLEEKLFDKPTTPLSVRHTKRQQLYFGSLERKRHARLRDWLAYYLYQKEKKRVGSELLKVQLVRCWQVNEVDFRTSPVHQSDFGEWPQKGKLRPL